jgi:outer membrane protein OmpA-like peptidoglycan-associated protein
VLNRFKIFVIYLLAIQLSCSFSQKIKDGEMAYDRKQYAVAVGLLEEEFNKIKTDAGKGRKAYLLGNSYMKLLEYQDAKTWYEKAVKFNYGPEALGNFAKVSKSLEEYESAMIAFQKLGDLTGRKQETEREILLCKQAIEKKKSKPEYKIERLFENTSVSDYAPVIYENEFLVFTSERKEATGKEIYKWTGEYFSDIFIMKKNGSEVRKFDSAINTEHNEGTPCFTKDMETMYFVRCFNEGSDDDFCKLMVSKRENDIWSEPAVLPFIKNKINYGHPALVENDKILIFTADIAEPGGTSDLYYTEMFEDGSWAEPEKLPESINTQGNEKFPIGDSDTLYFSSDYLPGFGGYDIFKTYLRKDRSWSFPVNLGYGINSGGDDFSFVIDYSAIKKKNISQQGFFVSSRLGSGKDDIFRFYKLVPELVQDTTKVSKKIQKEVYITVKTFTPVYKINDDPNSDVTGKTGLGETFIKVTDASGTKIFESYSDKNGFVFMQVPADKSLKITAAKLGYLNDSKAVSTFNLPFKEGETTYTINEELTLEKIYEDKEINLKNIYYDYDKWDIKTEAMPTLNALVTLLNNNPQIKIQLSSHTDCRGLDDYNMELSQKRAQSAVDYLISKGIAVERLIAQGYGKSQLIDTCPCDKCSEDQHQMNRRTTFKILKK